MAYETDEMVPLDEAAISNLLRILAPILMHGQGMRGAENEREARHALRTFLLRARVHGGTHD